MSFIENEVNGVVFMTSQSIETTHAFTTRYGGISSGIYQSLNLAHRVGDDPESVKENYIRLCSALEISTTDIVCSNQVHGINIRVITRKDCGYIFTRTDNQADAVITQSSNIALMVFAADCVPILLYDPVKKAIGAVHAGWRSTAADITGAVVQKMKSEFGCSPSDIKAAIGPCISCCCFETDTDVPNALTSALGDDADKCITRRDEKYLIDLKEANRIMLLKSGLVDIDISDECTSCSNMKYWSHRKTGGQRGSQVALIVIKDTKGTSS